MGQMIRTHLRRSAPRTAALAVLALLMTAACTACSGGGTVIFEDESAFGRVRVVEGSDGLRSLYTGAGRAAQTRLYPGRPRELVVPYTRVAMVSLALAPADGHILFIGLGGGAMPMYARAVMPEAHHEVVEIDPMIVDVAQRYFGFAPDERLVVHTDDGRAFIERAPPASYDVIVLDAFSDDEIPFALATREFLAAVRMALAPDGVVVANLWSGNAAYASMLATYDAVFDELHLIRVPRRNQRILVAGAGTRPLDRHALVEAARALAARTQLGFDLPGLVASGYEAPPALTAPVLTDR